MRERPAALNGESRGQSLVETALMLPLLLMIVLNVVNLAYFFLVVVNLTGAARTSVLDAIAGGATPYAGNIPSSGGSSPTTNTGSVTYLVYQDLTGAVSNPTGVTVQVCSQANIDANQQGANLNTGNVLRTNCQTCTSSGCGASGNGSPVPDFDPEARTTTSTGGFALNQVRITYSFSALIPGQIFNIPLRAFSGICTAAGSCTFTRQAEMRAMN
jgi:Flp pilus assembly protein TadG